MFLLKHVSSGIKAGSKVAAAALALIVILNIANIVARFVFKSSIVWAEEVMMYLLTLSVFASLASATLANKHISMDLLIGSLGKCLRRIGDLTALACLIVLSIYIVKVSVPLVLRLYQYDQLSEAARIPVAWPHAIVPLGFLLAAVAAAIRIIGLFSPEARESSGSPSIHQVKSD